ncbi:MAG TPA: ABC transporter ATP-binding protein [Chitinophagaceae bacterium]|nr:ABC transporter ATP-binding protein [Chitinophagaceae bacterium]
METGRPIHPGSTGQENAVIVENLVKVYRSGREVVQALRGVDFRVARGELFGIIGPDGAGKTSLFRIMTTLLLPDGGRVRIEGLDVVGEYREIRRRVGYMPGRFSLYQDLSVQENLQFFATIFNTSVQENYEMIRDIYVQIEPFRHRRAGKLSGGMKQKLALCCALIHRPTVLFLDEPTTGVDAVSRKEFWEMLQRLREQGITILVSTPYMDEASRCDRVALMQDGRLLSVDTPRNITAGFGYPLAAVKADNMLALYEDIQPFAGKLDCYPCGEFHHVVLRQGVGLEELDRFLSARPHPGLESRLIEAGIEDCFMALMKNEITQAV